MIGKIGKKDQAEIQRLFKKCVRYTKQSELEIMSWQLANEILKYDIVDMVDLAESEVEKYYLIFNCQNLVDNEIRLREDKKDIRACMHKLKGMLNL
jgi:hypothetical protein